DDPTSWSYQGAIHGSPALPELPGWNACQHNHWFFLPWHRMYLYRMERLLRAAVIEDGGPAEWALPYWNYDAGTPTNTIPIPFRVQLMPDGTRNPLFVAQRRTGVNAGGGIPSAVTSPAAALAMASFSPPPAPGFGGGVATPQHFWTLTGGVEQTPHNDIHNILGGPGGWMGDPDRAALDPIFWLHHANIDRLWSVWTGDGGVNPTTASWLNEEFTLFDTDGSSKTLAVRDTLDIVNDLDYQYDDVPVAAPPAPAPGAPGGPPVGDEAAPEPEMIGATAEPISLEGSTASVIVGIDPQAGGGGLLDEGADARIYMSVEHIDADQPPGSVYAVYVKDAGQPPDERVHVGNVSLFGSDKLHAARANEDHDHDTRLVFDVTDQIRSLGMADLGGRQLEVSFEPIGLEGVVTDEAEEPPPPIRIGRVSFFAG
ncbi:MAG: hypothetical protein K0S97_1387, partial [Chloroflexota bacterium]|nr:hypothetical protein [Chloroflexota bacterium]